MHTGDLRELDEARAAIQGCTHVIHAAGIGGGVARLHRLPHTLTEVNNALDAAVVRAALEVEVDRLLYVSSAMVFERAERFPTPEEHLAECSVPRSASGFSKLCGEIRCRAAHAEHGLPYTICRPFNPYGPGELPEAEPGLAHLVPDLIAKALSGVHPLPIFGSGEQTRTLTHVDDVADGIVAAMACTAGLNQDFNISASRELTVKQIARIVWEACDPPAGDLTLERLPSFELDVERRWPSVTKASELLGWQSSMGVEEGIAQTVRWLQSRPLPVAPEVRAPHSASARA